MGSADLRELSTFPGQVQCGHPLLLGRCIRTPPSRPSSIRAVIQLQVGWRRRSVGEPGFNSRSPVGATVSHGIWLCPNTSTSVPGNRAAHRVSLPRADPVSWTTASRTPSSSAVAISGNLADNDGPSLLPTTAINLFARASKVSSSCTQTQSPACTTTSASATARHSCSGRSRARCGTCVSAISSSFTSPSCPGVSTAAAPPAPSRAGPDSGELQGEASMQRLATAWPRHRCIWESATGRPADDTGYRGADGDCGFKTDFPPHSLASARAPVESAARRRTGNGREIRARRRVRHGLRSSPRAACGLSAYPSCN